MPKRLLNNEAAPADTGIVFRFADDSFLEALANGNKDARRNGAVKESVGLGTTGTSFQRFDLVKHLGDIFGTVVATVPVHALGKKDMLLFVGTALQKGQNFPAKLTRGFGGSRVAANVEVLGQESVTKEIKEARIRLFLGQITRSSHHKDGEGLSAPFAGLVCLELLREELDFAADFGDRHDGEPSSVYKYCRRSAMVVDAYLRDGDDYALFECCFADLADHSQNKGVKTIKITDYT